MKPQWNMVEEHVFRLHPDRGQEPLSPSETCSTLRFDLCGEGFIILRIMNPDTPQSFNTTTEDQRRPTNPGLISTVTWPPPQSPDLLQSHLTSATVACDLTLKLFKFMGSPEDWERQAVLWHHKKLCEVMKEDKPKTETFDIQGHFSLKLLNWCEK